MLRLGTVALLGMALTLPLPAWAEGDAAPSQAANPEQVAVVVPPQAQASAEAGVREKPAEPGRYRVGARIEGIYRFAHPYGVPPQVLPILPSGLTNLGL